MRDRAGAMRCPDDRSERDRITLSDANARAQHSSPTPQRPAAGYSETKDASEITTTQYTDADEAGL